MQPLANEFETVTEHRDNQDDAGDHLLVIARVLAVPYLAEAGQPLIRFRGRYPALA